MGLTSPAVSRLAHKRSGCCPKSPVRRNYRRPGVWRSRPACDFEPLISDEIFYKAQAVLSERVPVIAPLLKRRPDFPRRGFVRRAA